MSILSGVELLASLGDHQLTLLERRSRPRHYRRGEIIYTPGQASDCLYVVQTGRVKLARQSSEGREVALHLLDCGQPFGEEFLLDEPTRRLTAQSLADTSVIEIPASSIKKLLEDDVVFTRALLRLTAQRGQTLASQVEDLAFKDVGARLAACLLDLARHHGKPTSVGELVIDFPLIHEELGHLIGSTRETVGLTVDQFRKAGWIATKGRTFIICDESALRKRSSD